MKRSQNDFKQILKSYRKMQHNHNLMQTTRKKEKEKKTLDDHENMQNSQNKNTKLLKCEIKLYQQHPEKLHKDAK